MVTGLRFHPAPSAPDAPPRMLRVLHVRTVCGNGGGPDKTIFRGGRYLPGLGIQAEALYLLDANTPCQVLLARARDCQMPVHVAYEQSGLDLSGAAAMARLVRGGAFDVVHTHDYKSNTLARVLAAVGGYRIVATAHGYNRTTHREAYYYALEKLLLRRADAVICPSPQLAQVLIDSGVSRRRVCVLPNGIELDAWTFRPRCRTDGPLRILYVGRLSPEKNCAALLEACALLLRRGLSLNLRLAGDGPDRPALAERIGSLGLAGQAELLGHRDDVADLLAEADVVVNPSLTEAMPNSVLEALAAGVPVVATDVGATGSLVLHERTGLLVPPGDGPALAGAIERLAAGPEWAQQLALRGRWHVEQHFDFSVRMAHVAAIYRGVLAAGGGRT